MLLLAFLLSLIALLFTAGSCEHRICEWKPWNDSPENHGFKLFCEAEKGAEDPVEWKCGENYVGHSGLMVADWDRLGDNILELGELCRLTRGWSSAC